MAKTVEYDGRSWCHQQFYGLVNRLVENGWEITIIRDLVTTFTGYPDGHKPPTTGPFKVTIDGIYQGLSGEGETPWLALCDAIEKMEERS